MTAAETAVTENTFVKPALVAPKKPLGKFSLASIKEQLSNGTLGEVKTEVAEEVTEIRTGVQKDINPEELRSAWFAYAQRKQKEGKMSDYFILNRNYDLQNGTEIHLKVDNPVQVEQFSDIKADLLGELRRKLQNNKLNVLVEFVEVQEGKRLYTSIDKYNYLAQQFPVLTELKQRLGLDTDF
jgi:DNA polymerase-3 subunit gamma/tau